MPEFPTKKHCYIKDLEDPKIESEINSFVEKGNEFHDDKKYAEALEQYQKAWQALPEPKLQWEFANWISACMYSAYFDLADYAEAEKWGETTLRTRGSDIDTAPLIDLGMVCYELNQFEEAYKYFNDAYNYGKERAFQDRPKKISGVLSAQKGISSLLYKKIHAKAWFFLIQNKSNIKQEVHHVAIFNDVIFPRILPASFAPCSPLLVMKSSNAIVCARMKPFSKSVWILPAA